MTISDQYNKFYHGVLLSQILKEARQLSFSDWRDTRTGEVFTLYRGEDYYDLEGLKTLLKKMNLTYPITEEGKVSTNEITSAELHHHIEWTIRLMGENKILLPFIKEEWDNIMRNIR